MAKQKKVELDPSVTVTNSFDSISYPVVVYAASFPELDNLPPPVVTTTTYPYIVESKLDGAVLEELTLIKDKLNQLENKFSILFDIILELAKKK